MICAYSLENAHACIGCNAVRPSTINLAVVPLKRGHFNDRYPGTTVNFRDPPTSPGGG